MKRLGKSTWDHWRFIISDGRTRVKKERMRKVK
jgi:hypothetical protein